VFRFRSVVARTITLHLLAIAVTSLFMPLALYLMLKQAAEALHDRALREQAAEIVGYLASGPEGGLRLNLPAPLAELYSEAYGRYAFAVLDERGKVLFSSLSAKQAIADAVQPVRDAAYFSTRRGAAELYGVSLPTEIAGRKLWVQVSQDLAHRDVLIDDIVADFFPRVGWITAPILLLLLVIDVVIFRRALKPIVAASALAAPSCACRRPGCRRRCGRSSMRSIRRSTGSKRASVASATLLRTRHTSCARRCRSCALRST
jgi:hypothetical protein